MTGPPRPEITLRPLSPRDTDKIFQMSQEASLARFLPDQVYSDREEAAQVLETLIAFYDDQDHPGSKPYVLGVVLNSTGELVGHVGLSPIERGIEIGYAVAEKHQGRGFARQAVAEMLRVVQGAASVPEIYGIVDPDNLPSRKVLERCGFSRVGREAGKIVYKIELHPSR